MEPPILAQIYSTQLSTANLLNLPNKDSALKDIVVFLNLISQTQCKRINGYNTFAFLEKAEEGNEYCAEVIAHASPISKNSSSSDVVCVQVEERLNLFTGILCLFGVLLALVPLALAVWKSAIIVRYFCSPDEDIPDVLKEPDMDRRMLKNYYSLKDKSKEINSVGLHEDRLLPRK
ncbi:hypothetical protein GDO78_002056 [Eleutherodactylus coqui]|uniref:Interferon/interleukin receptor domain-containing protein n=1 Tax=Eleutherodactylus coqui TaxID=57060 RepID=A0A8J6FX01_ELECQ|nr:hypothetical protein GDO78_002056 [Eleutherodactylus coqui]